MSDHESPERIDPVWSWVGIAFLVVAFAGHFALIFLIARGTRAVWSP